MIGRESTMAGYGGCSSIRSERQSVDQFMFARIARNRVITTESKDGVYE
jgi:hypothetical protein